MSIDSYSPSWPLQTLHLLFSQWVIIWTYFEISTGFMLQKHFYMVHPQQKYNLFAFYWKFRALKIIFVIFLFFITINRILTKQIKKRKQIFFHKKYFKTSFYILISNSAIFFGGHPWWPWVSFSNFKIYFSRYWLIQL